MHCTKLSSILKFWFPSRFHCMLISAFCCVADVPRTWMWFWTFLHSSGYLYETVFMLIWGLKPYFSTVQGIKLKKKAQTSVFPNIWEVVQHPFGYSDKNKNHTNNCISQRPKCVLITCVKEAFSRHWTSLFCDSFVLVSWKAVCGIFFFFFNDL